MPLPNDPTQTHSAADAIAFWAVAGVLALIGCCVLLAVVAS